MKSRQLVRNAWCATIGALLLSSSIGAAEESPPSPSSLPKEAQPLLPKAAALSSYRVRFTLEAREETGKPLVRLEGRLFYERPNRRRLELKGPEGSEAVSQMLVSDGSVEWQYYPATNTVYRIANPPEPPGPHRPFAEARSGSVRFVERLGKKSEELCRFEAAPLATIVEGSPVPIKTLRVDVAEADGLVRQLVLLDAKGEPALSQQYHDVEINVSFPEGTFAFTAPEGAQVVELGAPPSAPAAAEGEGTGEAKQ